MVVGFSIMFKASNKVKCRVISLFDNKHSRKAWQKVKDYRGSKKESFIR